MPIVVVGPGTPVVLIGEAVAEAPAEATAAEEVALSVAEVVALDGGEVVEVSEEKPVKSRKRARVERGRFRADDRGTPAVDEAWQE